MRHFLLLLLLPLLAGCIDYGALVKDNPKLGGTITATLDQSETKRAAALGHAKNAPFLIEGASNELTFSATLSDDAGGADAFMLLSKPNGKVTILVSGDSRNQLEVHLLGTGCVVNDGALHISMDEAGKLSGDFEGTGPAERQEADGRCEVNGTLTDVPVTHDE
jgi:hypothetical protein